jgi:hypothetical protein
LAIHKAAGASISATPDGSMISKVANRDSKGTAGVAKRLAGRKAVGNRPKTGNAKGAVNAVATRGMANAIRNHPRRISRFWNHRRMPAVAEKLNRAPRS